MPNGHDANDQTCPPEFDAALRQLHRVTEQLAHVESSYSEAMNTAAPDLHAALRDSRRILEHMIDCYAKARGILFRHQPLPDEAVRMVPNPADQDDFEDDEDDAPASADRPRESPSMADHDRPVPRPHTRVSPREPRR